MTSDDLLCMTSDDLLCMTSDVLLCMTSDDLLCMTSDVLKHHSLFVSYTLSNSIISLFVYVLVL